MLVACKFIGSLVAVFFIRSDRLVSWPLQLEFSYDSDYQVSLVKCSLYKADIKFELRLATVEKPPAFSPSFDIGAAGNGGFGSKIPAGALGCTVGEGFMRWCELTF